MGIGVGGGVAVAVAKRASGRPVASFLLKLLGWGGGYPKP